MRDRVTDRNNRWEGCITRELEETGIDGHICMGLAQERPSEGIY